MTDNKERSKNEKIESLFVTKEMASDEAMDQQLREGLIKDAKRIEEELSARKDLAELDEEAEEKLYDDIVRKLKKKGIWEEEDIINRLSPKDQKALELGRKMMSDSQRPRKKPWKKALMTAAVVMIGVFTISMTSEANRLRLLGIWNSLVGQEMQIDLDNDEDRNRGKLEEQEAYSEIKSKLGIEVVDFLYKPEKLIYDGYSIAQDGGAYIFYEYENSVFTVYMYQTSVRASRSQIVDGEVVGTAKISVNDMEVEIREIENAEGENSFVTGFTYENVYYALWGQMELGEFEKLVSGIYFK